MLVCVIRWFAYFLCGTDRNRVSDRECVLVHASIHTNTHTHMRTRTHTHTHTYRRIHMCTHIYMYTYLHIKTYICEDVAGCYR